MKVSIAGDLVDGQPSPADGKPCQFPITSGGGLNLVRLSIGASFVTD
jgi:hypothetical protein